MSTGIIHSGTSPLSSSHGRRSSVSSTYASARATPPQDLLADLVDVRGEQLLRRQGRLVLRRQHLARQVAQRVLDDRLVLRRAEDEADRRVLAVDRPVLARVVQVHVHLT